MWLQKNVCSILLMWAPKCFRESFWIFVALLCFFWIFVGLLCFCGKTCFSSHVTSISSDGKYSTQLIELWLKHFIVDNFSLILWVKTESYVSKIYTLLICEYFTISRKFVGKNFGKLICLIWRCAHTLFKWKLLCIFIRRNFVWSHYCVKIWLLWWGLFNVKIAKLSHWGLSKHFEKTRRQKVLKAFDGDTL